MSFFEPLPPPRPHLPQRQPAWAAPPRNEIPVGVPDEVIVGRSADAAVWVGSIRAYSIGFELALSAIARPAAGLQALMPGHPRLGAGLESQLRFGLRCADGTRAEAERRGPGDAAGRSLNGRGGGGDGSSWSFRYWSWPLPPPGSIELFCLWPPAGIDESSALLDAGPILAAAARVEQLWPDEDGGDGGSGSWSVSTMGPR
jgi:hypothetical protein